MKTIKNLFWQLEFVLVNLETSSVIFDFEKSKEMAARILDTPDIEVSSALRLIDEKTRP